MNSSPFYGWPAVPDQDRPKAIYILNLLPSRDELAHLEGQGYVLVDVRSIKDKRDAVEATLEGIRFGTIEGDPKIFKFLELEAKILKMTSHLPTPRGDEDALDNKELDTILNSIKGEADAGKEANYSGRKADPSNQRPKRQSRQVKASAPNIITLNQPEPGNSGGDEPPPSAA
jgi:hypothetical protein